jgi:GNAT superfamily N-acetyltransferase
VLLCATVATVLMRSSATIRPAEFPADMQSVLELYRQTTTWHAESWPADILPSTDVSGLAPELEGMTSDRTRTMLVAELRGAVAGLVTGHLREPPEGGMTRYSGRILFIGDVVVDESQRRSGVATALIHSIEQWGATEGATTTELWVHAGNDPAANLYQHQGYRPVHIQMRKDFD